MKRDVATRSFDEVFDPPPTGLRKIQRKDYLQEGRVPIIDQGEDFIAGYTNDPACQYVGPLPVIVFGDHTRRLKFVDFRFALGADGVKLLLPRQELDAKYVYYCLTSQPIPSRGYSRHFETVRRLKFQLVNDRNEQRLIAEILDEADRLRSLRAEANAKTERVLPALFIKMFGDPATNPKRWPTKTLGDLGVEFRYGTSQQCDSVVRGVPVLRIPNVMRGKIDTTSLKYTELSSDEKARLLLRNGDVLFVRTNGNRDYVGRSAPFDLAGQYCFASYLIRARTSCLDPYFMSAYYSTPAGRRVLDPFIRTTAGQSNLNVDALKRLPIYLPDNQSEFASLKKSLDSALDGARIASERAELLFSSLIQRAFSDKLTERPETRIDRALTEAGMRP